MTGLSPGFYPRVNPHHRPALKGRQMIRSDISFGIWLANTDSTAPLGRIILWIDTWGKTPGWVLLSLRDKTSTAVHEIRARAPTIFDAEDKDNSSAAAPPTLADG